MKTAQRVLDDICYLSDYTIADISRFSGIHANTLYRVKKGKADLTVERLRRVVESCGYKFTVLTEDRL